MSAPDAIAKAITDIAASKSEAVLWLENAARVMAEREEEWAREEAVIASEQVPA